MSLLDTSALIWFVLAWAGYASLHDRLTSRGRPNLVVVMEQWRFRWADAMARREVRIIDSQLINGLVQKDAFFASTSILMIAGLVALFGSGDRARDLATVIPIMAPVTPIAWSLKVGLLAAAFVYAFFKFGWAIRQHSYSAVVVASIPEPPPTGEDLVAKERARKAARLGSLGAKHFNDGVRAYYFAVAGLGWFIHPIVFIAATTWVTAVLYRRDFLSRAVRILSD